MNDDTKALVTRLRKKAVDSEDFAPESGAPRYYREISADIRKATDLIERLSAIEERAKEVLREREDSTAAYILEGGTRHVGKPDARKGLTILRDGPAQPGDLDADND